MGLLSSLAMLGLAGSEGVEPSEPMLALGEEAAMLPLWPVYLGFAALFLATAGFVSLGGLQVGLFFSLSALQSSRSSARLFGLGFALVAAILLLRRGWFFRRPLAKAALAAAIGGAALLAPLFASLRDWRALGPALVGVSVFLIFILGLAKGRYFSAFAPKKRVLRLADYKLNSRQTLVVKLRIAGKTAKQIAVETKLPLSTVRNVLSQSYRKLGIEGSDVLMTIGERYTVE